MVKRKYDMDGTITVMPSTWRDLLKDGRSRIPDYHLEIAYALTAHGDNDEIPTLLFAGSAYIVLRRVFTFFVQCGIMKKCRLYCHRRYYNAMGKVHTHMVAEMHGYDNDLCSLDNFYLMLEHRLQSECWCNVRKVSINRFVNL